MDTRRVTHADKWAQRWVDADAPVTWAPLKRRPMVDPHRPRLFESDSYRCIRAWIITHRLARQTIVAVKLVHTAIFLVLLTCVLHLTYAGIRNRVTSRTMRALVAVTAEGFVLGMSGRRCPLTVVVEDLGSTHGSVSDIFLPNWIAQRIFPISSTLLSIGAVALVFHRTVDVRNGRHGGRRNSLLKS